MTIWCNNFIEIRGSKDKIRCLYVQIQTSNQLLNHLHPIPALLRTTSESGACGDGPNNDDLMGVKRQQQHQSSPVQDVGYNPLFNHWCVDHWYTRCDVDPHNLTYYEDGDRAVIKGKFDSASGPPLGAYDDYLNRNMDVSIEAYYYECSMDIAGKYQNGNNQTITPSHFSRDEMQDPASGLIYTINKEFKLIEDWHSGSSLGDYIENRINKEFIDDWQKSSDLVD